MKAILTAAALLALAFGTSVVVAGGPEKRDGAGADAGGKMPACCRAARDVADAAVPAADKAPTTQSATCPKCRIVMETTPMSSGHNTVTTTPVMHCPDCTNAVMNFLTKGVFKHTCTTCGDKVDEMCNH